MDYLLVKAFFKGLVTANGWEFAHNQEHLSEKIGSDLSGKDNLILVMDEPRGKLKYNGNHFDQPNYGFWLMQKVDKGDWEAEDIVFQAAKDASFIIVKAMEEQKEAETGIFEHYNPDSVDYLKAGPETKSRLFGIYVSFGADDTIAI